MFTYLLTYCHHQNDSCIKNKMGNDESHFNISYWGSDGQSHRTVQCPQTTTFSSWTESRAEALSNQGPSTYQPNALPLGQTGSPDAKQQVKPQQGAFLLLNVCFVFVPVSSLCYSLSPFFSSFFLSFLSILYPMELARLPSQLRGARSAYEKV